MRQHTRGRRLGMALLVVGLSSGLGRTSAPPAQAQGRQAWATPRLWPQRPGPRLIVGRRPALARPALVASSPVTWTQQAELTSTVQTPNDGYGAAVALSGDTAVIGAPGTTGNTSDTGAADVSGRTGSIWTQQAPLVPRRHRSLMACAAPARVTAGPRPACAAACARRRSASAPRHARRVPH